MDPGEYASDIVVPCPTFVDFHPYGNKWKVKARLIRMVQVINSSSRRVMLRLVLLDGQGDAMEAIVGPGEVEYFRAHLYEGMVYFFTGVDILPAAEKFKFVPYHYRMSFNEDTRVEYVVSQCDTIPLHWDFSVRLSEINNFLNQDEQLIDVVGLVVNVTECRITPNEQSMYRDIVLLDQSMTFVRLTLWNEFATRDGMHLLDSLFSDNILFATGLKVEEFHGPQLKTWMTSKLYVNHPFCIASIRGWLANNERVKKLVAWNRTSELSIYQSLLISNAKRIRIKEFASMPKVQHFRIIGRIEKIDVEHLWVDLCETCFQRVEDQYGHFVCNLCGQEDVRTITRYNVKMVVKDSTGSMEIVLKDTKAEFILRCVPSYLKQMTSEDNGVNRLRKYISQYHDRAYVFIIPAPKPLRHEQCTPVVTFVLKVNWSEECSHIFK